MSGAGPGARPGARRWGWHRLDPAWADRVVAGSAVRPGDLVVDVGAGTGALTAPLVAAGARVIAVELHPARAARLRERFDADDVRVLEVDLADLRWPRRPFRVVANPPYALARSLVRSLLTTDRLLGADVVLPRPVVRQLAERPPRARHARRVRLEPGRVVPRTAFTPPPGTDARVLRVRR